MFKKYCFIYYLLISFLLLNKLVYSIEFYKNDVEITKQGINNLSTELDKKYGNPVTESKIKNSHKIYFHNKIIDTTKEIDNKTSYMSNHMRKLLNDGILESNNNDKASFVIHLDNDYALSDDLRYQIESHIETNIGAYVPHNSFIIYAKISLALSLREKFANIITYVDYVPSSVKLSDSIFSSLDTFIVAKQQDNNVKANDDRREISEFDNDLRNGEKIQYIVSVIDPSDGETLISTIQDVIDNNLNSNIIENVLNVGFHSSIKGKK